VRYLLDTNVVSELRKPARRRAESFNTWASAHRPSDSVLSVITIMELRTGIESVRRTDPAQADTLTDWLDNTVLAEYEKRLLAVDLAVAERCARLHVPATRPAHDALIAASALVHGLTVVTRNTKDFNGYAVPTINPWQSDPT
jgi:predicted nucleic acid-binding protein